ncbi:concanavalin A-like lectin/glucanase domain-containing protein [Cokeromyces recurvatus]|uniref:concanavalin A-like lectin/glucanase domain-containing protein n=1 Tax=Cokeromyces recurvatus TaxID=90255 RepID=UPI00221F74B3|nr:concanavalin A-like lectin/glucanase domain-containing protein [Cokeromyces recurvatus]KAI7900542.1 concanavalin A-like lectin/glucanase domain-containing protein [Cokeromyces recurvatus]
MIILLKYLLLILNTIHFTLSLNCDCGYFDSSTNAVWSTMYHLNFQHPSLSTNNHSILYNNHRQDLFFANYTIPAKYNDPYSRIFHRDNVRLTKDSLEIMITRSDIIQCGGVGTRRHNFLFGSFRAYIKTTHVHGTVSAFYIYNSPTAEIDIEILSALPEPRPIYFAIHPNLFESNGKASVLTHGSARLLLPFNNSDPTHDFHEYRIDWFPGLVVFYLDGYEAYRSTTNVMRVPSRVMLNHWTDGNPKFSQGPVKENATIRT